MLSGGCVITLEAPSFDPLELLRVIDRHKPQTLVLVGDSFAKPLLNTLNANPGAYDLSSVAVVVSSGVMWSLEVKQGLLEHMPGAMLNDAFSSSEALGMGASVMMKGVEAPTAKFMLGGRCKVFDENDQPVEPGSGVSGMIAIKGPNPLGYYKDDEKTARTFRVIDGERYSIPGDWCLVEADGTLTLLGRGSACINTAGEKVFPEEVEEALKTHPRSRTPWSSACPTRSGASRSPAWSAWPRAPAWTRTPCAPTSARRSPATRPPSASSPPPQASAPATARPTTRRPNRSRKRRWLNGAQTHQNRHPGLVRDP
uniref:AMP-binding protein n=1 Tax=Phenylobacterium glaciei TaxID=2803784 RepID=A0A974P369_9CAUL|nr:AMP-binding protein [Phenylobacterium glaciei]